VRSIFSLPEKIKGGKELSLVSLRAQHNHFILKIVPLHTTLTLVTRLYMTFLFTLSPDSELEHEEFGIRHLGTLCFGNLHPQ
jgi:hypothetical protein